MLSLRRLLERRAFHHLCPYDPAGQAEESKPALGQEVIKESPIESPAGSQNKIKNESQGDRVTQNSPVFDSGDLFWRVRQDPRDSLGDSPENFMTRGRFFCSHSSA